MKVTKNLKTKVKKNKVDFVSCSITTCFHTNYKKFWSKKEILNAPIGENLWSFAGESETGFINEHPDANILNYRGLFL